MMDITRKEPGEKTLVQISEICMHVADSCFLMVMERTLT